MKKFLRISICVFITLSMFCGCKADGALDDEKLSDLVNSENGSNEEKNRNKLPFSIQLAKRKWNSAYVFKFAGRM